MNTKASHRGTTQREELPQEKGGGTSRTRAAQSPWWGGVRARAPQTEGLQWPAHVLSDPIHCQPPLGTWQVRLNQDWYPMSDCSTGSRGSRTRALCSLRPGFKGFLLVEEGKNRAALWQWILKMRVHFPFPSSGSVSAPVIF